MPDRARHGAVDFRLRPPAEGFLATSMFADPVRSAGKAEAVGSRLPASAIERSLDRLLAEMDEAGIAVGVITGRVRSVLGHVDNDDIARIVARHPDRFVAFAGIDPRDRHAACAAIDATMAAGFKGASLEPGLLADAWHADDRRLYPVYAHCEAGRVPVLLMTGGNAGPDLTYSHPAAIDRVAADFPGLTIIAGHGGWPWAHEILQVCFRRPNIHLSPDVYLNPGLPGAQEYVDAANGFLADRFLFGSAYPFSALDDAMRAMAGLPFAPAVRAKVMHGNARRLLGLAA